ncbi:unnamed protein product [Polarella glacialis]|uniref:Fe2OG dioxygenase domain-containing protein n=1 Tax=Polarella glacialis TaxID=89957 RepID=A0A813JN36_POLGL|nr:unnamed protein product [Polarella glacialis]
MPVAALTVVAAAGLTAVSAAAAALGACGKTAADNCSVWLRRKQIHRQPCRDQDVLVEEVRARSMAVLYTVSDKTNSQFSVRNLSKYLKMKGVEVYEGSTPEETLAVNAERLIELLDKAKQEPSRSSSAARLRHEVVKGVVLPAELEAQFPAMKEAYVQQPLDYGRNSRYGDKWRISCYLVVMENWKPKIEAHEPMVRCMASVMEACRAGFATWHCQRKGLKSIDVTVMNAFVTRYRPTAEEDQLKKHIDGASVDGSVILALPTDECFEGGALHVWDGKPQQELVYQMQPGDVMFLDNAVWHQAKPITSGERWALVLFLKLRNAVSLGS